MAARKTRDGTVWLVFDAGDELYRYQCYWFGGPSGDRVLEHDRVATDVQAVAWGMDRATRIRIRLPDHQTYWAGSAPNPGGFAGTWSPGMERRPSTTSMMPAPAAGLESLAAGGAEVEVAA
jgi:hypothetical protein